MRVRVRVRVRVSVRRKGAERAACSRRSSVPIASAAAEPSASAALVAAIAASSHTCLEFGSWVRGR